MFQTLASHGIGIQSMKIVKMSEEWNRRRMKLFLYLLRAPVYGRMTSPAAESVFSIVHRFPILGGLIGSYMREWLLYWKHPFSSEES